MPIVTDAIIDYPVAKELGLDVDPIYRELQQRGPARIRMPYGGICWLATRYEDIRTVHVDRRFTNEPGLTRDIPRLHERGAPTDPNQLASMDPPRHTRIRRLASRSFSPPRIRRMRTRIETLVDDLLEEMLRTGPPADFFSLVSSNLPNLVMTGILGIPRSEPPMFRAWIDLMLATTSTTIERIEAQGNLRSHVFDLIEQRRRQSTDDVLGALVEVRDEEDQLTEDELVMLCINLFLGGFETSAAQLGSTMYVLMANRELWSDLLDNRKLLTAALEELWRWIPSRKGGGS